MDEESADHLGIEILDIESRGNLADIGVREAEEQPEGVAIGGDRVGARLSLVDQAVGEERLEGRSERGHRSSPKVASNRSAASRSSSGAACKYQ